MEELIQKIINIDDKTKTLVSQSREREASLRDDLNQSLDQLESSSLTQAREKALSSYEKTYSDLMDQVNQIRQENHQRLADIDERYQRLKGEILKEALEILNLEQA